MTAGANRSPSPTVAARHESNLFPHQSTDLDDGLPLDLCQHCGLYVDTPCNVPPSGICHRAPWLDPGTSGLNRPDSIHRARERLSPVVARSISRAVVGLLIVLLIGFLSVAAHAQSSIDDPGFERCATQGGTCHVNAGQVMLFGIGGLIVGQSFESTQDVVCDVATFGYDPAPDFPQPPEFERVCSVGNVSDDPPPDSPPQAATSVDVQKLHSALLAVGAVMVFGVGFLSGKQR